MFWELWQQKLNRTRIKGRPWVFPISLYLFSIKDHVFLWFHRFYNHRIIHSFDENFVLEFLNNSCRFIVCFIRVVVCNNHNFWKQSLFDCILVRERFFAFQLRMFLLCIKININITFFSLITHIIFNFLFYY